MPSPFTFKKTVVLPARTLGTDRAHTCAETFPRKRFLVESVENCPRGRGNPAENLTHASHIGSIVAGHETFHLKWVYFQQDAKGRDLELQYYRDVDGREVDFVVVERRRPILFLECKWKDAAVAKGLN